MFQVSETIASGETAKPSWILMWKEKSESCPACLMLKENKAVEQATLRESSLSARAEILITCPVPLFKKRWALSDHGFSEHFIRIRGRGIARVAGDICQRSPSTWLGTSLPAHSPLSEIKHAQELPSPEEIVAFLTWCICITRVGLWFGDKGD